MSALKSIFGKSKKPKYEIQLQTHNDLIDYHMDCEEKNQAKTTRILLLGPGDSGKTTIVKQLRRINHIIEPDDVQCKQLAGYIKEAVVGYAKILCSQSLELHKKYGDKTKVHAKNEPHLHFILSRKQPYKYDIELASSINAIWLDPAIKETLRLRAKYQIHDNVQYFMDRVAQIYDSNYSPVFEDYLRIRTRSTGLKTERITSSIGDFGDCFFEITDVGGQKSQRHKWLKMATEEMDVVLYVLALSEYDLMCYEDDKTNRLVEALNLFKTVIDGKYLDNKTVFVFFNKYDLFVEKIKKKPITIAFPDYPKNANPYDADKVVDFVMHKFKECLAQRQDLKLVNLYFHPTSALDENKMRLIYGDIILDLVRRNLKFSSIV